uniref:pentapeptide repeat-containing protein n=1 Tax=Algoriphagus sp. TaxID=1872435 RepID=UPI004048D9F0
MSYFSNQHFQHLNSSDVLTGEYDACTFSNCNFATASFQQASFENCLFEDCDLSNIKVVKVNFQTVRFVRCKMLGIAFAAANPFLLELHLEHCILDYCNFYKLPLKKSRFLHSQIREVDFSQANLREANFQGSDLLGTVFDQTNLEKVDFREALHYRIAPELNAIKGARFDLAGLPGLLESYGIKVD